MRIVTCVKQVLATDIMIRPTDDGKRVDPESLKFIVNPYDEFAVEEALRIKEKIPGCNITVISMGDAETIEAIRNCLALGADDAVHLKDDCFEGADANTKAFILSESIKKHGYDLILCGKQSVDDDNASVGIMLAEMLNIPHVAVIIKLEISEDGKSAIAHREAEGCVEIIECSLPAVFTCQKGLNIPRFLSLANVMKARRKRIEQIDKAQLQIPYESFSAKEYSKARIIKYYSPPKRESVKIIPSDDKYSAAQELARILASFLT